MESGDWRAQLQRQTIVSKIMDILKKYLPFSGYDRLQKLKKIAERVEQEIFTDARSQSEYARKICFMTLTMETRLQNPMPDPMQSSSAAVLVNPLVAIDTTAQTNNPNGGDWQEEVYQKIKAMKELYLLESSDQNQNMQNIPNTSSVQLKQLIEQYNHSLTHQQQIPEQLKQMLQQQKLMLLKQHMLMLHQPGFIGRHNKLASLLQPSQQFVGQHTTTNVAGQDLNTQNVQNMSSVQGKQQHLQLLLHQYYRQLLNKRQLLQNLTLQPVVLQQQMLQQPMLQQPMMVLQKNQLSSLRDASGAVGDPTIESGDWRDQLQADSRERIVNNIIDTLKIHFPFSGHEEPQEHKKIAESVEEEIYIAATSQYNYLLKIVLKMLTMVYAD